MGERAGYRLIAKDRGGNEVVSPIYRTQWYLGGAADDLAKIITAMAKRMTLFLDLESDQDKPVGGGWSALREDLDYGRAVQNFFHTLMSMSQRSIDSIENDANCDIDDHGLFTLRIVRPLHWVFEHQKINRKGVPGKARTLIEADFVYGKRIAFGGMELSIKMKDGEEL